MAYKQYGTTWWGRKWLDSLSGIDLSNRIPRGLSYARNDKVFGVKINAENGTIIARVVGRYSPYYEVSLQFKRIDDIAKKRFLDLVVQDLEILTKLTNRELSPKLFDLAEKLGIRLFPTSWQDIKMQCNCPDFAVPCKHIAAVIYTVSELFDANPYLIFELIGINLTEELEARHVFDALQNDDKIEIPSFAHLYRNALIGSEQLKQIAKEHQVDLTLTPIDEPDAELLYRADNLYRYSDKEVILDEELRNDLKSVRFYQNRALSYQEAITKQKQAMADVEQQLKDKVEDIALQAPVVERINNKRGRRSSREDAILALYGNLQEDEKRLRNKIAPQRKRLEELEQQYNEAQAQTEALQQENKAKLDAYHQRLDVELRLGYNPESEQELLNSENQAVQEAEAAQSALDAQADPYLSDLDAIDLAEDDTELSVLDAREQAVSPDTVAQGKAAPAAKAKGKGRKSKAQSANDETEIKESEATAEQAAAVAANAATVTGDTVALAATSEGAETDSGEPQVRRYQGSLNLLARLTYVTLPNIGESLLNLFSESAAGFTKGNLRTRFNRYLEKAAAMATKQLKDKTDRDPVQFDYGGDEDAVAPAAPEAVATKTIAATDSVEAEAEAVAPATAATTAAAKGAAAGKGAAGAKKAANKRAAGSGAARDEDLFALLDAVPLDPFKDKALLDWATHFLAKCDPSEVTKVNQLFLQLAAKEKEQAELSAAVNKANETLQAHGRKPGPKPKPVKDAQELVQKSVTKSAALNDAISTLKNNIASFLKADVRAIPLRRQALLQLQANPQQLGEIASSKVGVKAFKTVKAVAAEATTAASKVATKTATKAASKAAATATADTATATTAKVAANAKAKPKAPPKPAATPDEVLAAVNVARKNARAKIFAAVEKGQDINELLAEAKKSIQEAAALAKIPVVAFGNAETCAAPFSSDPISEHGYFSHFPLFYLDQNSLVLKPNVPFNVSIFSKGTERHLSLFVFADDATVPAATEDRMWKDFFSEIKSKDKERDKQMEIDQSLVKRHVQDCGGLFELFSGFVQGNNIAEQGTETRILYYLWYIASNLVQARAVMPQLLLNEQGEMQCRWIPATVSEEIRDLVTQVGLALQGYEHFLFNRLDRQYYLNPQFLGELVLSPFIQSYMAWAFRVPERDDETIEDLHVFFNHRAVDMHSQDIEDQGLRYRLENWLAPLSSSSTMQYIPVLRFVDLLNYGTYGDTIFADLEEEILAQAQQEQQAQDKRMAAYEKRANKFDTDLLELNDDLKQAGIGRDGFKADAVDTVSNADGVYSAEGAYSEEEQGAFSQERGVGIELGFIGFPAEMLQDLKEAGVIDATGFVGLRHIVKEPVFESVRQECLRTVSRLAVLAPSLNSIFDNKFNVAVIPLSQLYNTIHIARTALQLMGVRLVLPKSLQQILKPSSVMKMDAENKGQPIVKFLDLESLLSFKWQVAIGDHSLDKKEFEHLLANAGQVVRFKDSFVYADPDMLKQIQTRYEKLKNMKTSKSDLLEALLTGTFEDHDVALSANLENILSGMFNNDPIELPQGLKQADNNKLREYQVRGYEWLIRNSRIQVGSILADDMGLGKTLQVIAAILRLKEDKFLTPEHPALVVVPTSLINNWIREINDRADNLKIFTFYGNAATSLEGVEADIILTTYGTARSRIDKLQAKHFSLLVIDEAQNIKSLNTAVNKALRTIEADQFIAMSGTPVENRLLEYYSILDFVNRGMFGSVSKFSRNFAVPIERDHDSHAVERFKRLTAPFIMRRLKTDKNVINDLPDKIIADQYCTLTPTQVSLYEAVVENKMRILKEASESGQDSQERRAIILSLIQNLKAICNSPAQYAPNDATCLPEDSGKVERLLELLEDILSRPDDKVLIFTQSVVMGRLLQGVIESKFGREPQFLYGGLDVKTRMAMVDKFQHDAKERVLLLSLRAAGTGLNLTQANNVIHFDLWWNPAVENQATDRAFRIGQKRKVNVYRFICANTFEERINDMLISKRDLADMAVVTGENWIGSMSDRQLNDLFSLHAE